MRFMVLLVCILLIACSQPPESVAETKKVAEVEAPAKTPVSLEMYEENGLYGYRESGGETVIGARFDIAGDFEKGLAQVVENGAWAIINTKGEKLFDPFIFDNGPDPFQEGLARFVLDGKIGFYDSEGKVAIPATYDFAKPFESGKAHACMGCQKAMHGEHSTHEGGAWFYINKKGERIAE